MEQKFNPEDEETFQYADSTKITVIDGVELYETIWKNDIEYKTYLSETDYVNKIEEYWKWHQDYLKNNPDSKIKTKQDFIKSQIKSYVLTCADYSIKMSDLVIKGYNFSVAQAEMIKNMDMTDIEKLVEIIQNHFKNKRKRHWLSQELFTKLAGKIDSTLFAELCFSKDSEKEHEVMEEFFCSHDTMQTKAELEKLLDNEYLRLYPKLKESIRIRMTENLGLQ
jgi:hypothetical protein